MSPFACSLFALAALLATAHGDCSTKRVGYKTDTKNALRPVEFQPPGTELDAPLILGQCPRGMHVVGADIVACNNDPDGPAPDFEGPPPDQLFPVYVFCFDECPYGGYTQITLYCDYVFM